MNKKQALVDMDGTVCNFGKAMSEAMECLRDPAETYRDYSLWQDNVPPHIEARMSLIKSRFEWWFEMEPIPLGLNIVKMLKDMNFDIAMCTKSPDESMWSYSGKRRG